MFTEYIRANMEDDAARREKNESHVEGSLKRAQAKQVKWTYASHFGPMKYVTCALVPQDGRLSPFIYAAAPFRLPWLAVLFGVRAKPSCASPTIFVSAMSQAACWMGGGYEAAGGMAFVPSVYAEEVN